jgi:hypothetical protein
MSAPLTAPGAMLRFCTAWVASLGAVTASARSWRAPTLPAGTEIAAYDAPDIAKNSATVDVTLAKVSRLRIAPPLVGFATRAKHQAEHDGAVATQGRTVHTSTTIT